jgi:hypothetical protein
MLLLLLLPPPPPLPLGFRSLVIMRRARRILPDGTHEDWNANELQQH